MSNQRVVVLTDEPIERIDAAMNHLAATRHSVGKEAGARVLAAESELERLRTALLEYPEGITEWRAFVGDEGESNDYADVRGTLEQAVADLAILLRHVTDDDPYDRQGIESRQCGPWVGVSRTVGQVNG